LDREQYNMNSNEETSLYRPFLAHFNTERQTSALYFNEGSPIPEGHYYMRGGICFPVPVDGSISGYAVMCGRNLVSNVIYVFEEREFFTIDHVIDGEKGGIKLKGLSTWFNDCWTRYYADTFYFHQDHETCQKYRLQVVRSPMIANKPHFVEIKWSDDNQAMHTVFEKDILQQLKYSKDGKVYQQLQEYNADQDGVYPALHSLKCALSGYDRYPARIMN